MWVATGVTIIKGVYDYKKGKDAAKSANQSAEAEYAIDVKYHAALQDFSSKQLDFAAERQTYANQAYGLAVASRNQEIAYREEALANKKNAAVTEYNAQQHVSNILQQGAKNQSDSVIQDEMRALSANKRNLFTQADKELSGKVAKRRSGLAQGRSKDRILADAFIQRNKMAGQLNSKAKASVIQTIQAKDKVTNDTSLKLAESYRGLSAVMAEKVAPVAFVPPPTPVFDYVAPIRDVSPQGYVEGPDALGLALGVGSSLVGGYAKTGGFSNTGATFEGPTLPGGESGYYDWGH